METNCIYWAQLSRFRQKSGTEFSLRNVVFLIKDRTIDKVQNSDCYIAERCRPTSIRNGESFHQFSVRIWHHLKRNGGQSLFMSLFMSLSIASAVLHS
jgi:hypothetical protein